MFLRSACASFLVVAAAASAWAQPKTLGYADCEKCHKAAVKKWKTDEPAQLGGKAHFATLKQLSDPKAAKFAAALGLADPLAPAGRCVECHATVVRGRPRAGVSCETCHGPASDYLAVHDKEPWAESYKKSLPLGMRDLHAKAAAIAKLCVDCHVTPEKALAQAGHPNGAGFDAGASLRKLVHWSAEFTPNNAEHARYADAEIAAAAKPLVAKALSGAGGGARPPAPAAPGRAPAAVVPAAQPAPWDWDQPVAPLPADYPSDADPPAARPAPAAEAAPAAPPRAAPRPRVRAPAPSIAEDQPLPLDAAPVLTTEPAPPAQRSPQAEAVELLVRLLEQSQRVPGAPAPLKPREFKGPDAELLHLQDVVFYLALETLRKPR